MKVLTIGRSSDNDVVINDPFVGRHHCQLIKNNDSSYNIVDLGSANGTYVNGARITGGTKIKVNDIIRIGNTTLPWQGYFDDDNTRIMYNNGNSGNNNNSNSNSNNNNNNNSGNANNINNGMPYIQQPFIPSDINIKQNDKNENVNINADVYKSGDDFKVPFKRNVGRHVGDAVGQVGGCLVWLIAIIVIGGIIALCL